MPGGGLEIFIDPPFPMEPMFGEDVRKKPLLHCTVGQQSPAFFVTVQPLGKLL